MQKIAPKTVLIVCAVVVFGIWGFRKFESHRSQIMDFVRFNTPAKTASAPAVTPKVSELSPKVFAQVNEGLLSTCANNHYGLTREDCVQTVNDHKENCQRETVQSYPDTTANQVVLQEVIAHHVSCIFRTPSYRPE